MQLIRPFKAFLIAKRWLKLSKESIKFLQSIILVISHMQFPFFSKKTQKQSYYLGIFLKEEEGILLIINQNLTGAIVQEKEKFNYSNGWENLSNDIDEILYRMEKKLNYQFSKTIFFVYSHLVDDKTGDIKKPYLQKIKDLVKNLEIEAVGYIECYEAVSSLLEDKEEIPLTAVLVELDKSQIGIFVYKGGKLSSKKIIAKTDNIALDLMNGFEDFKGKVILPARIILYDSHQLDSASSEIISHRWDEDYFVQVPRVDIFSEDQVVEGLVRAFYQQLRETKTDLSLNSENKKESPVMGFMINEDIKDTNTAQNKVVKQGVSIFTKIKNLILKIKVGKPSIKMNFSGKLLILIGVLIISISLFLNEYFLHKVNITVYLPSIKINKVLDVNTDYKVVTSSATLSEGIVTTGKKDIGDPSTGTVTMYNFSDAEKLFSKGTIINVSNIKFSLNDDVKVASSTLAADGSAKLPGKNTVAISASLIGPEGNLSKGQRFTVADLPLNTYFAINEAPLTGGTKKQIKTASSADQEELKKLILSKAEKGTNQSINTDNYVFDPKLTDVSIKNISFSKEVGEEGDKISANATTLTTNYGYDNQTIIKKVFPLVKNDVQPGYLLMEEMVSFKINKIEKINSLLKLNINAVGKSIKDVSKKEIIQLIMGSSVNKIEAILKAKYDIQGYNIKLTEPLPLLNNVLPFFPNNINVNISSI